MSEHDFDDYEEELEEDAADEEFDLDAFRESPDDQGLSLEDLSQAYADLLDSGEEPYTETDDDEESDEEDFDSEEDDELEEEEEEDERFEISPRSILEAMLFVGHPGNEPLTSRLVASFMRGVRPAEIDQLVKELNDSYDKLGCPYHIESAGAGYRLVLREEFNSLRDKFYGRVKAAKLSQAAVDVLAIVAYKQPMTREEIDVLRNKPSGAILGQLVRRELLRMERTDTRPRITRYYTTDRFLQLFGLDDLQDLPQSMD